MPVFRRICKITTHSAFQWFTDVRPWTMVLFWFGPKSVLKTGHRRQNHCPTICEKKVQASKICNVGFNHGRWLAFYFGIVVLTCYIVCTFCFRFQYITVSQNDVVAHNLHRLKTVRECLLRISDFNRGHHPPQLSGLRLLVCVVSGADR